MKNTDKIILTEHDYYLWKSVDEILNNPKITEEVKKSVRKYIEINYILQKHKIMYKNFWI